MLSTDSAGVPLTDTDTVAITVTAVADIVADILTTNEDTAITANVITGTSGASADNFESGARALTSVTQGANGSVSFTAAGAVTYTPNLNFNGTDSFTYTVTSGGVTETATLEVTIAGTNDAAVITGIATASLTETDAVLSTGGTLSATDVDSSSAFVARSGVAGSNGYGVFAIDTAGAWTYATNTAHNEFAAGQSYTDSFTVATADGTEQIVTVTIAGTDEAPVISDVTAPALVSAVAQGATLTLTYNEVLDAAHQPSTSYFGLIPSTGPTRNILGMRIEGNTVVLNLSSALLPASSGTTYTLQYTDPSAGNDVYGIQDLVGNDAASYAAQAVTVNAAALPDTAAPTIAGVILTPGTNNASVTLQFTEAVSFLNATGLTLTTATNVPIAFTLAAGTSPGHDTLVLTTSTTLAATDVVIVGYNSTTGSITDTAAVPNALASVKVMAGGEGGNTISAANSNSAVQIRANSGNDTITGSSFNDVLFGGPGADTLEGGGGADTLRLFDAVRATDTVKLLSNNTSFIPAYDTLNAFDVSNAGGTNNDVLNLPSGTIAADTGVTAGVALNGFAGHSIAGGMVRFYDAGGVAVAITNANKAAALNYLSLNLTQAGRTVGFALDSDGNGQSDSVMVFQDGVAVDGATTNSDIVAQLAGVNGVTLSNTAGQNVVQIVDTTAPSELARSFTSGANAVLSSVQSEDVIALSTGTVSSIQVNGSGANVLTGSSASGNTVTNTTNASLAQTDWLLFNSGANSIADTAGNIRTFTSVAVVGGSADNLIDAGGVDVSTVTGAATVRIDSYAGNDQITGTAAADVIIGGTGADVVSGGLGADQFRFTQGDSTAVSVSVGGDATLNTGDRFTFAGGLADVVHGRFDVAGTNSGSGDRIEFRTAPNQFNPTSMVAPTNGLVTDQKFYTVRGNYDAEANAFDVSTLIGLDTLVVYDGDATSGVSQTALVVQGHAPGTLTVSGNTLYANVADTDGTAPTLVSAAVNGTTLSLSFSEAIDGEHTPMSTAFPLVLVNGVADAVVSGSIAGNVVTLILNTAVIASDVVSFSYTDPTSGNDANALQDLAGNDVGSVSATATNQTPNIAPVVTSAATADFAENGTGVAYLATATDVDGGGALSYSIGGADALRFNINATTGAVTFITSPNFEAPTDAGGNNVYDITVSASDGVNTSLAQAVAITVTNVNDNTPVVSSAATASFAENGTGTVYTATATDADAGSTLSYSLGGADALRFNINATTGAVSFTTAPNFEAPTDAGGNNVYDITVAASDGVNTSLAQAVAITVTDVVEAPPSLAGQSVIDLGSYGKLIAPVQVDGGNWFYFWDRSGNGTNANTGTLNGGVDYTTHDVLDGIFNQDINGVVENPGNGVGIVGDTDNTYRYATLNGVHLALPTAGGVTSAPFGAGGINNFEPGTAVGSSPASTGSNAVNATYNDLLAVWDAYNGTGVGSTAIDGTPSGWQAHSYWSATPSASGHADVLLLGGHVVGGTADDINLYVALQVL